MSKVQGRDASLLTDLANTTIAGQLESRLRELERNIAVARQFIKLADECYTQVRREWELLQQDTRSSRPEAVANHRTAVLEYPEEATPEEPFKVKQNKPTTATDKHGRDSGPTSLHAPSLGAKPEAQSKKETQPSNEGKASTSQKTSRGSRRTRRGQASSKV